MKVRAVSIPHVRREHPPVDDIKGMKSPALWRYVIGELDFLSTPEQKRVPLAVATAMRELSRRDRSK